MRRVRGFEKSSVKVNSAKRSRVTILVLFITLVVLVILATAIGAVSVPFTETARIILKNWGLLSNATFAPGHEPIIFLVRFPRVLTAIIVGGALAAAGTVMQGMFRNPMADPGVIGISSGASLGAVTAIMLGLTAKSIFAMPIFAVVGALGAALIIYLLSSRGGKVPVLTLVLAGIAVSTFFNAFSSIMLTFINEYQVKAYLFWMIGGLSDRRWEHVTLIIFPIMICLAILLTYTRDLNVLLLGEEEAQSIGLNAPRTRKILLFLSSVIAAMAVCVSGSISFVGLVVPHIMRMIVGPDHRVLLPASILGGAVFLVACDLIARIVLNPRELGVGIVTSLIGAPYFLYLLVRARSEGGI